MKRDIYPAWFAWLLLIIAASLVIYILAKLDHPSAVWLMRDMLGVM